MTPENAADNHEPTHNAADLETIVVDADDVLDLFRRNARDADEQRTHSLRVSPPFEGEREASLHVSQQGNYYPPEMDPKPIHIGINHLFGGRPDARIDAALAYPDRLTEKSLFRDEFDARTEDGENRALTDDEQDEWDAWWDTAIEVWESNVRAAMRNPREIELGGLYAEQPTTTVMVRFEAHE